MGRDSQDRINEFLLILLLSGGIYLSGILDPLYLRSWLEEVTHLWLIGVTGGFLLFFLIVFLRTRFFSQYIINSFLDIQVLLTGYISFWYWMVLVILMILLPASWLVYPEIFLIPVELLFSIVLFSTIAFIREGYIFFLWSQNFREYRCWYLWQYGISQNLWSYIWSSPHSARDHLDYLSVWTGVLAYQARFLSLNQMETLMNQYQTPWYKEYACKRWALLEGLRVFFQFRNTQYAQHLHGFLVQERDYLLIKKDFFYLRKIWETSSQLPPGRYTHQYIADMTQDIFFRLEELPEITDRFWQNLPNCYRITKHSIFFYSEPQYLWTEYFRWLICRNTFEYDAFLDHFTRHLFPHAYSQPLVEVIWFLRSQVDYESWIHWIGGAVLPFGKASYQSVFAQQMREEELVEVILWLFHQSTPHNLSASHCKRLWKYTAGLMEMEEVSSEEYQHRLALWVKIWKLAYERLQVS